MFVTYEFANSENFGSNIGEVFFRSSKLIVLWNIEINNLASYKNFPTIDMFFGISKHFENVFAVIEKESKIINKLNKVPPGMITDSVQYT